MNWRTLIALLAPLVIAASSLAGPMNILGGGRHTPASEELTLEQDWQNRISGDGVVWFHNFESDSEVDNFRFIPGDGGGTIPNDPGSNVRRVNDGYAGGGYLEINVPQGIHQGKDWRRPFSPLLAGGNGRATDDPGANGTITRRTYDPDNTNSYNWTQGWWGHEDYVGQGQFDGTTKFYIQMRMRMSAGRFAGNNPEQGKLVYIDAAPGLNQELIITSRRDRRHEMYTSFGSAPNSFLSDPQNQEATGARQPGGPYDATCRYDQFLDCWRWTADEWVTVLIAITPGRHWSSGTIAQAIADPSMANTGIEMWFAREGETSYTKVWDKLDYVWAFENVFGWNMLKASTYMNGATAGTAFQHHYRQIIFSREFIACPQVWS